MILRPRLIRGIGRCRRWPPLSTLAVTTRNWAVARLKLLPVFLSWSVTLRLASETEVKFKLRYVWLYFRDDSDVSLDVYNPSPILVKALKKLNKITMSNIFT